MHTAIIYYDHDKFAVLYYNESDRDWEIILDEVFGNSTTPEMYNAIMSEFMDFLYDFDCCTEDADFDFSEFIYEYDDEDFYMVEVRWKLL